MLYAVSNNRDIWNAVYWRRPMAARGAVALLVVPLALLALQLRDCLKRGWWPRSTADAALFCLMMSAVMFVVVTFVSERWRVRRARMATQGRLGRRSRR